MPSTQTPATCADWGQLILTRSINGAAWTVVGNPVAVSLTLNGTTKALPASFTIAAAAASVTAN